MKRVSILLSIAALVFYLISCGGSGGGAAGPSDISGYAVAGAPIKGDVWLKDANGTILGPVKIGADGSYSFSTAGLTPPFVIKAEGCVGDTSLTLTSASANGGTVNINPLTHLAVSSLISDADAFTNFSGANSSLITSNSLGNITDLVNNVVSSVASGFGATGTNFLSGSVPSNMQGFDGMFDALSFNVASDLSVSLENRFTGQSVTSFDGSLVASGQVTALDANAANMPAPSSTAALRDIQTRLTEYAQLLRAKGAALTSADVDGFYSPSYGLWNGYTRSQFVAWEAEVMYRIDTHPVNNLSHLVPVTGSCDPASDCTVLARHICDDGTIGLKWYYRLVKENGTWMIMSNGKLSYIELYPQAARTIKTDGTIVTENGIRMWLFDMKTGNNSFGYATITGPGLPAGGVTLTKMPLRNDFALDAAHQAVGQFWPQIYYKELDIDAIPNNGKAEYTVRMYSDAARTNLVEERIETMAKRPLKNHQVTDAHFGTFTPPATGHSIAPFQGTGTWTFNFTPPTAFNYSSVRVRTAFWGDGQISRKQKYKNPSLTATSIGCLYDGTNYQGGYFTSGALELWYHDAYDRYISTHYMLE
jgi:hypothetical protein